MANMNITNIDYGSVALEDGQFRDELLTFAAGATLRKGTILARLTAGGKLTPFVTGGTGGAEIPVAVLTYDVARASAGDEPVRVLIAGKVKRERLIIAADGTGVNVTTAVIEALRHMSIVALNCMQLGDYDTQD